MELLDILIILVLDFSMVCFENYFLCFRGVLRDCLRLSLKLKLSLKFSFLAGVWSLFLSMSCLSCMFSLVSSSIFVFSYVPRGSKPTECGFCLMKLMSSMSCALSSSRYLIFSWILSASECGLMVSSDGS